MSKRAERQLMQHLLDPGALAVIAEEGLIDIVLPTAEFRPVYQWSLGYYFDSNATQAPSLEAFEEEWTLDFFIDRDVDLTEPPEDTVEWVIDTLKGSYVHLLGQQFTKELALSLSEASSSERVQVLSDAADALISTSMELARRSTQMDLREGMGERLRAYEQRKARGEITDGLLFGLPEVDDHTGGIHPGELGVLAAPAKMGKAQPLDTPVLTPSGWTLMGDLQVGDEVIGSDGQPTRIVAVHPQGDVETYHVVMNDGASTRACGEHLWKLIFDDRNDKVLSTLEVKDLLDRGCRRSTYIPMVDTVSGSPQALPIAPRLLGLLLGDGSFRGMTPTFTSGDDELLDEVASEISRTSLYRRSNHGVIIARSDEPQGQVNSVRDALVSLNLWGKLSLDKSIPEVYLRATVQDRMALLSGLMDADGGQEARSAIYYTSSPSLRDGVVELVNSLGGVAHVGVRPGTRDSYRISVRLPAELGCPFVLKRKADAWETTGTTRRPPSRRIVSVESIGVHPSQCITVDAPDSLYVTEDHIVTHNSYLLDMVALREWQAGRVAVLFTLENSVEMTLDRIACLGTGVDPQSWLRGDCHDAEEKAVRAFRDEVEESDVPLYVVQPELERRTMEHIIREASIRDADSVLIDQLTFVHAREDNRRRDLDIREMMHDLKELISTARRRLPCLLAHQVNREGTAAARKTGHLLMDHMAEGAEVERTADFVFGLYQSDADRAAFFSQLQMLAARRVPLKHWELHWHITQGVINIRREITIQM